MKSLSTLINPSRFALLLKKELKENRRQLLLRGGIIITILVAASLFIGVSNIDTYERILEYTTLSPSGEIISSYRFNGGMFGSPKDEAAAGCAFFYAFAFPIALAISASFMFEGLSTKQKRIATLMTPGTIFEKYLARFIIYIFGTTILFGAGCLIADYIRYIVFSLSYIGYNIVHPIDYIYGWEWIMTLNNNMYYITLYLTGVLFGASLFTLGSSVWPRVSFVKTFGAIAAIGFTCLFTAIAVGPGDHGRPIFIEFMRSEIPAIRALSIGFTIMSIINFILAYFRAKESEVRQRM